jgi:alpha-galactosidase
MNVKRIHFLNYWHKTWLTACILFIHGLFCHLQTIANIPVMSNQPGDDGGHSAIVCAVQEDVVTIKNANTTIRIHNNIHFELSFDKDGKTYPITDEQDKTPSVYLSDFDHNMISFIRKTAHVRRIDNKFGYGKTVNVEGESADGRLMCRILIEAYDRFPDVILIQATFKNISDKNCSVHSYTISRLGLDAPLHDTVWWSFQGACYKGDQDFVFQLPESYQRDNYMGLNLPRSGGGIPFVGAWNKKFGLALAYLGETPRDIYLPLSAEKGDVRLEIRDDYKDRILDANDSLLSVQTAIIVHNNDFYDPLRTYSSLMRFYLPAVKKPAKYAYQSEWCTWGYEQTFTSADILNTLERLKFLGIKSVIIDDGWYTKQGDWRPSPAKFPKGDEDFKLLVNKIHEQGFKVWLWWVPGYIDSCSDLAAQHPDWLIKREDRSVYPSYGICPAFPPVQEYYKTLVLKFINDYKIDGFKLDLAVINTAPPCFNPVHRHDDPFESYKSTPLIFETIYRTAIRYNPDILIEYCPCSRPPTIFHLPWANMAVTSDPLIYQITSRIKMYKALMGDDFPVLEEYVGVLAGPTYPLAIGTGGIPGTFNTILDGYHEKWMPIYQKHKVYRGQYLNLYDIAFDYPEAHVIKKDQKLYYAFYTHPWEQLGSFTHNENRVWRFGQGNDYKVRTKIEFAYPAENYSGKVNLRGLDKNKKYRVLDYGNNRELGLVNGDEPYLNVSFDNYLLLEVSENSPPK